MGLAFVGQEQEALVSLAVRAKMTGVCARSSTAATAFAAPAAGALASRLRSAGAGLSEPASQFLGGVRQVRTLRADLASVPGWRMPLRLLGERVMPSPHYIRARYPRWPRRLLWLAYVDSDWFAYS